jgi:hypothetical protein
MGFRFRKTIKILPGVRVNLSKSGVTTSLGVPGATINVGSKSGPRATVGLPGTGLSYRQQLGPAVRRRNRGEQVPQQVTGSREPLPPAEPAASGRSPGTALAIVLVVAVFVIVALAMQ